MYKRQGIAVAPTLIVFSSLDEFPAHPTIESANAADNNNLIPFFIFLFSLFLLYSIQQIKKLVLYTKDELPRVTTLI